MSDYSSVSTVKARLGITDTTDDTALASVLTAASRWIDRYTDRRFYGVSETRYYTAESSRRLRVDDLLSVSALATDDDADRTYATSWASTDYELWPPNALLDSRAYSEILVTPNGSYTFPWLERAVKVTGSFGYTATGSHPATIEEACILLTMRFWKRKDAIFGIGGAPALNVMVVQASITADADIQSMLAGYARRVW